MEDQEQQAGFEAIDPTLRAHVYGLVSALGGPSPDNPSMYVLGDDVLGCLRDIKRWLKGYDEKLNRLDVARCLSEANIVAGDLVEILSHSGLKGNLNSNGPNKICLACVELLVPLTWPLEKADYAMTVNHHRHISVLRRSQAYYKQIVLSHSSKGILKACCVNALPPMAVPMAERTSREEGIIRLILYLLRNLLQIENIDEEDDNLCEDISRSATVSAFETQGAFNILLAVISGIPQRFEQQDVIVLEVLFSLLKGIDFETFGIRQPLTGSSSNDPLAQLLRQEDESKSSINLPSRHNRFGTTVVLQKDNGHRAVLSGASALVDEKIGLQKLDATKKWRKPQNKSKKQRSILGNDVQLSISATNTLRRFLAQVIQSGFDSLFLSVRKSIERDAGRLLATVHPTQLFYVGSTVLQFGRNLKNQRLSEGSWSFDFAGVSTLLQPETFIVLFRHMRESLEIKLWDDIQAGCLYFIQILLAATEMVQSENSEEKSVAENILNRLFYEETLHDMVVAILRSGCKRPTKYLNTVTQLAHVYLRTLEKYSKQNANMVVKSKRAGKQSNTNVDQANDSDENEDGQSQRLNSERQFNFQQCEAKFLSHSCIDPFLELLERYIELDQHQVKRCISFLHRVFVKRAVTIQLFRLRTILLFYNLAQYSAAKPGYADVGVFIKYFSKQLTRKLSEHPVLYVELLFQKSQKTSYFLQYGKDKDLPQKRKKLPSTLEIKGDYDRQKQVAIATSLVLQNEDLREEFKWIEAILERCIKERETWEAQQGNTSSTDAPQGLTETETATAAIIAIKFQDDAQALKHLTENRIQLLMRILGFHITGTGESDFSYFLPSSASSKALRDALESMRDTFESPLYQHENGQDLLTYVKVTGKQQNGKRLRRHGGQGGDRDQGYMGQDLSTDESEEDFEFPDNLASENPKGRDGAKQKEKKISAKGKRTLDEAEVRARQKERRLKEKERRQGIKSALYVGSSDDDSDVERDRDFFENERKMRDAMSKATIASISAADATTGADGSSKKRPSTAMPEGDKKRKRLRTILTDDDEDEDEDEQSGGDAGTPDEDKRSDSEEKDSD